MPVQRFSQGFKDISLSFKRHPVTNDILALKNEDAIKRSVQNLIRIQLGEVFFNELIGTRITGALFELANDDFVDPIKTDYRGFDVYECPPNGQGIVALIMLNILKGFNLAKLDPNGEERMHLEAEASVLAYRDRNGLIADPDVKEIPTKHLLSNIYSDSLRKFISSLLALLKIKIKGNVVFPS